jgi:hypothetical protein
MITAKAYEIERCMFEVVYVLHAEFQNDYASQNIKVRWSILGDKVEVRWSVKCEP